MVCLIKIGGTSMILLFLFIIIITVATIPSLFWLYLSIPFVVFAYFCLKDEWERIKYNKQQRRRNEEGKKKR